MIQFKEHRLLLFFKINFIGEMRVSERERDDGYAKKKNKLDTLW